MDVSQYLYAAVVGVIVVVVGVVWLVARARNRIGVSRIEPGMGSGIRNETPVAPAATPGKSVVPPVPAPNISTDNNRPEMPPETASKVPEGTLEQGYKGYRIRLREKEPGLWIASIADARARKKQAEDRSSTGEYYQMPAALAEAKVMIDRRLEGRR